MQKITQRKRACSLFCFILGFLLLLPACQPGQVPVGQEKAAGLELVILHTNDIHSHIAGVDKYGNACFAEEGCTGGMGRIAAAIEAAKKQNDNVIALDAGDEFQGTLFYSVNRWPMLAEIDKYMPYDAMTLGNHEFDEGCADAAEFTKKLNFPVLAANLTPEKGCPMQDAKTKPYIIKKVRGGPVGIIGLANDEVVDLASACKFTKFENAADVLTRTVKELEAQGVQHIIVLTHLGLPYDRELARRVDGIDVIVGGHTHSYLGENSEEGPYPVVEHSPAGQPVLVVTAKRAAVYLGELQIVFNEAGVPVSWMGKAKELTPDMPSEPHISALIEKYAKSLDVYRSIVVGSHELCFADGMDACREGECLGGMVIADAMLEYARPYGAVMALHNGGGVRAALPQGNITRGDLLSILPFGGTFVLRELTGDVIKQTLEHGVSEENAKGPRLLQTAGLKYTVDPNKPAGKRISNIFVVDESGKSIALNPKVSYRVVLPSYLARGGDGYAMFKDSKVISSQEPMDVDVLEAYIRKHSPLAMPITGRINWK